MVIANVVSFDLQNRLSIKNECTFNISSVERLVKWNVSVNALWCAAVHLVCRNGDNERALQYDHWKCSFNDIPETSDRSTRANVQSWT